MTSRESASARNMAVSCVLRGSDTWENLAETTDMGWQKDVIDIFQKYTERDTRYDILTL